MNKTIIFSMLCINFATALLAGPREMAAKIAASKIAQETTKTTARKIACGYVAGSLACGTTLYNSEPYHSDNRNKIKEFIQCSIVPSFLLLQFLTYPPYCAYLKLTASTEQNK